MKNSALKKESKFMQMALDLAEKGRGRVSPNPLVGACLVKNGRVVGRGYHKKFGDRHAEVNAIRNAGKASKQSTLYVTLEPCSTWGKTPPCISAIKESGIKKVVVGAVDPNPKHLGRALKELKKSGIAVSTGLLADSVAEQNEGFFKRMKTGLPFVTLKMAQSLDGKIATKTGQSKWISSPASREFVQKLRAGQDAILVGKNTFHNDNPRLTVRGKKNQQTDSDKPWRIVIDPKLERVKNAKVLKGKQQTIVVVSTKYLAKRKIKTQKDSLVLLPVAERKGKLDLKSLLKKLAQLGVNQLLVEGGGELAWSLLKTGLVDRALWVIAPKVIGGRNAKTSVEGDGFKDVSQAMCARDLRVSQLGKDVLLDARF